MKTAEEKRDVAVLEIQNAIKHLAAIVVDQADGHDEFNSYYRDVLKQTLTELISIRDRLSP